MRRRAQASHAEEENFLVSSADLMACVLFVFILLALVFAIKARGAQQVADEKGALLDEERRQWGDTNAARADLLAGLKRGLERRGIVVEINQEGDGLQFPQRTLTFDECSNQLKPSERDNLVALAEELQPALLGFAFSCRETAAKPPVHQVDVVLVEGHTDRRPPSPGCGYRDNWSLSTARAAATRDVLLQENSTLTGLCNQRGRPLFAIAGYAEQRPASLDNDDENRRIELRFIMRPPSSVGQKP